jgi:hypothetical protein
MDIIKTFSRRSLLLILLIMILFVGAFAAVAFTGLPRLAGEISHLAASQAPSAEQAAQVTAVVDTYAMYLVPAFALFALILGLLLWLLLRGTVKSMVTADPPHGPTTRKSPPAPAKNKDAEQKHRNQRLFLHLLAVLQREGRLVDFFQEDLEMHEDEQIGTAVRTIHGKCKKILNKNLSMQPIIAGDEGDAITVETGFDPDAIKLTGRVTGAPPFKGTIRHKGWRTNALEMPDLSAIKDPTIIYPAEVEID